MRARKVKAKGRKWEREREEREFVEIISVCSVTKLCPTLCDHMDCSRQAPLSMEFSRQEYWSGLPFPPPGDLPDPGIKPMSPASLELAGGFFTSELTGKPEIISNNIKCLL